mgnify:CR=1 FL=1
MATCVDGVVDVVRTRWPFDRTRIRQFTVITVLDALRLRPGDRISEAEIAARFGVSRQPVRDAFTRLANLDLLLIRPQRATEVKRFSAREIEKSRFVRAAVEAEVLRRAALAAAETQAAARQALTQELSRQRAALAAGDAHGFSALDYAFHRALCTIAGAAFARHGRQGTPRFLRRGYGHQL